MFSNRLTSEELLGSLVDNARSTGKPIANQILFNKVLEEMAEVIPIQTDDFPYAEESLPRYRKAQYRQTPLEKLKSKKVVKPNLSKFFNKAF